MADTIRSLSELNQLFADNGTGNVSAQDIRDLLASLNVHTSIGMGNWVQELTAGVWTKIPLNIAGTFERGFVQDLPNNRISSTPVRLKADIYQEIRVESLLASDQTLDFAAFITDTQDATTRRRVYNGAGGGTWTVGVQLQQDDYVDMRVRFNGPGTYTIDVDRALLRVKRIGVE